MGFYVHLTYSTHRSVTIHLCLPVIASPRTSHSGKVIETQAKVPANILYAFDRLIRVCYFLFLIIRCPVEK